MSKSFNIHTTCSSLFGRRMIRNHHLHTKVVESYRVCTDMKECSPPPKKKNTSRDLRTYMRWPIFLIWAIYWRQKLPAGIAKSSDETWFGACSFCCLGHQVHHTVEDAFWEACSSMSLEARQRMPMAYHRCQLHNPIKFSWQLAIVVQMGCAIISHLVA